MNGINGLSSKVSTKNNANAKLNGSSTTSTTSSNDGGGGVVQLPSGAADGRPPPWKIGLVNSQGKYLTAETFGFKINAAGMSLRRKQLWIVEQDRTEDDTVYIRSHLGRYLSGDRKVSCMPI